MESIYRPRNVNVKKKKKGRKYDATVFFYILKFLMNDKF